MTVTTNIPANISWFPIPFSNERIRVLEESIYSTTEAGNIQAKHEYCGTRM
jgi:hypothetical protein